ncbi:MAG: AMP-binding protein, partial [Pirellulales bacterium]|nr:AMP-binding protein [Pirellulales bacterium]
TTGKPKGVTLTHGNLVANTSSIVQYLKLTSRDSVFAILPFYYSYGNSLLLTHLSAGGRLILASDFVFWNRAVKLMKDQGATGFSGVPSTFAMLFHRSQFASMEFPNLRYLTCAGGALAPAVVTRLRDCVPESELFLMYGQTEATARLSTLMPADVDRKLGSIGTGIPGVTLKVLDAAQQPTAAGEVGEIYASGSNVMKGYWQDKAATEQVLGPHGLRTGDLAKIDQDGYIYIVGRRSDMIKSGAYRINPQEIEEVILEMPGIEEVAVVGQPDEFLGEAIVAYVVPADQSISDQPQQILNHCKQRLPPYKRLRKVELVSELPKTSSGKIRRAALRN